MVCRGRQVQSLQLHQQPRQSIPSRKTGNLQYPETRPQQHAGSLSRRVQSLQLRQQTRQSSQSRKTSNLQHAVILSTLQRLKAMLQQLMPPHPAQLHHQRLQGTQAAQLSMPHHS